MDTMTPSERSERMALIRSRDTKPELAVRSLVHGMGYRYRLHAKDLPGHPDLTFKSRRKVISVHGCFWHLHHNCPKCRRPKSNRDYWKGKLERNQERDGENVATLAASGWESLIVWECETADEHSLKKRLRTFLGGNYKGG